MIAGITDWILSLGGAAALAIVFLVPALEASAFLGFLFPGEVAVLLGGVLAYNGRVPLSAVIAAAVLGAIVGDTIGYFVGRRWGHQILRTVGRRVPFLGHRIDEHLENARAYLKRRGGIAIFLGRFTAALRVMVPGLAGMAEMPYREFFVYKRSGGRHLGGGVRLARLLRGGGLGAGGWLREQGRSRAPGRRTCGAGRSSAPAKRPRARRARPRPPCRRRAGGVGSQPLPAAGGMARSARRHYLAARVPPQLRGSRRRDLRLGLRWAHPRRARSRGGREAPGPPTSSTSPPLAG